MRVVWIIYGGLDQATGGYVYDRLIIEALRQRGVSVTVLSIAPGCDPQALSAEVMHAVGPGEVSTVVGDALCINELGPAFEGLNQASARLLLVHHFTSWEVELASDVDLLRAEARAIAASDQVVTTSRATAIRIQQENGGSEPSIVAPGANRLARKAAPVRDKTHLRWLGVGSLVPRKRWELLLEALDQLADPQASLRLIGDGTRDPSYTRNLERGISASAYLRSHVEYLGVIDDGQLGEELARADALILPSSLEGYGMVVGEALHAELPVIAARTGAAPELVRDGQEALLFDNAVGLIEAMRKFAADPALRAGLRQAAKQRASTLPSWEQAGAAFYNLVSALKRGPG